MLRQNGQVTRNEALRQYCSRLGALIAVLKREGWKIEGGYKDNDYVYKLSKAPYVPKFIYDESRNCMVEVKQTQQLL